MRKPLKCYKFYSQITHTKIGNPKLRKVAQRFTVTCNLNSKMALKSKIGNDHEEAQHFTTVSDFQLL